ncbi:4'-phosphopantetheinyl transferase superfamily protein [Verminephrobacter aporrectodeae subsp. tuberculatae]|nr:4'-phosphopantetheinyl transferase superfamily protein [Verminephrobacter aporrectodeae subsp. tuberculatae]MCW8203831.1 4'-phosphopantetheinyl transferase superfamily protein [Verminephrobacter aporrectodeae subsp. tuberculatae]
MRPDAERVAWHAQDAGAMPLEGLGAPLHDGEVRIVCAPVASAATLPSAWLDAGEQQRWHAYRFAADRQRHHAAHALKRWVIGAVLGASPQRLAFAADARGKPRLVDAALHFNLSHSGAWVSLALRRDAEVGVDVEQAREPAIPLPWPAIRHPEEPDLTDSASFLKAWTLKEAVSKCCGQGLALDFSRLRLEPTQRSIDCYDDARRRWHAWHARLDASTHLALASDVAWRCLRWWRLSPAGEPRWAECQTVWAAPR